MVRCQARLRQPVPAAGQYMPGMCGHDVMPADLPLAAWASKEMGDRPLLSTVAVIVMTASVPTGRFVSLSTAGLPLMAAAVLP
jgi:hypothetical protein